MEALTTVINSCSGRSTAMYLSSNRRGKYLRNYPYILAQLLTTPTNAVIDHRQNTGFGIHAQEYQCSANSSMLASQRRGEKVSRTYCNAYVLTFRPPQFLTSLRTCVEGILLDVARFL